jgi:hypothetical protein
LKKKITCQLCQQTTDIYTDAHKSKPFVDGKLYSTLCFTCFFVPKTIKQVYNSKGLIKEEIEIPYSCQSLNTPKEIYNQGSAESLKQAKKSFESLQNSCKSCKKTKDIKKIKPNWILS